MRMDSVQVMQDKQKKRSYRSYPSRHERFYDGRVFVFEFPGHRGEGHHGAFLFVQLLSSFRTALFEGDALLPHEAPILLHMAKKQPLIAAGYIA